MHIIRVLLISFLFSLITACGETVTESAKKQFLLDISSGNESFLGWYNGYGGVYLWGIGDEWLCRTCYKVTCGDKEVKVTFTYDTHSPITHDIYPKSKKYARVYNTELKKYLMKSKNACNFILNGERANNF